MSQENKLSAEITFEESDLFQNVRSLKDPRTRWTQHSLLDIVTIAIMAVVGGADDWNSIQAYGEAKKDWLRGFLRLSNGIPSHDTFNSVISRIEPTEFANCCLAWMKEAASKIGGQVISIDGKNLKNSYDRAKGQKSLHMVSAWVSSHRLLIGQVKTSQKSNEITAIPKLLELIDIRGHIVTIDAMGCQKAIVSQIVNQGGDYIIGLKGNQKNLHKSVAELFETATDHKGFGMKPQSYQTIETGHHRTETRQYCLIPATELKLPTPWSTVQSLVMVTRNRSDWRQTSNETHFYLSNIPNDVEKIAKAIRTHWGIENQLHWSLDIVFGEDASRIRQGHGAENFATMRRQALGLLNKDTSLHKSIRLKRYHAAMDNDYLVRVLFA